MSTATVEIVAEWEPGTFLENLAPLPDSSWLITIPSHQRVDRVDRDGLVSTYAHLDALPTGIVTVENSALVIAGHIGHHDWALHRVTGHGIEIIAELPDLTFGNGMTRDGARVIVADSAQALLLAVDPAAGTSHVWRRHELLAGFTATARGPGANGVTATPAGVYVTNTSLGLLLRFPRDEAATTEPVQLASDLEADDFTVASDGTTHLATHYRNTVVALHPDDRREVIAGPDQGVFGSTSVAIDPSDPAALYVTTTGGMRGIEHHEGRPARLLRLRPDASSL